MNVVDMLYQHVGQLVLYGGVLVAIAYGAFRLFAVKWLENKFAERLAAYKHEQAKELEKVRFEFKSLFDKLTKYYQKEFEVMPEAWIKLNNAYWKTGSCVAAGQKYPDLDRMSESQANEFIQSCPLEEWQKDQIRQTKKKTDCYIEHISWHRLDIAMQASREFHIYLKTNGIFLKPELKNQFGHIDDLIWKALVDEEFRMKSPGLKGRVDFEKEMGPLMQQLETDVQRRLRE